MSLVSSAHVVGVIRKLAENGEIGALEAALKSGVVKTLVERALVGKISGTIGASMGVAIDSIDNPAAGPRIKTLLSDWRTAAGISSVDDPSEKLSLAGNAETAHSLLALGAQPHASIRVQGTEQEGRTVLAHVLDSEYKTGFVVSREILRVLAHQDVVPLIRNAEHGKLETLYDWVLSAPHYISEHLLTWQIKEGIPRSWSLAAGSALRSYIGNGNSFDDDYKKVIVGLKAIALASFDDPKDWCKILMSGEWVLSLPSKLANGDIKEEISLAIVDNMVRDGVHPDQIHYKEADGRMQTWLHVAISADNVFLTKALLEKGADPSVKTFYRESAKNAFEIAELLDTNNPSNRSEIKALLAACKARNAIQSVINKSRAYTLKCGHYGTGGWFGIEGAAAKGAASIGCALKSRWLVFGEVAQILNQRRPWLQHAIYAHR